MFGFLKQKLQNAVSAIKEKFERRPEDVPQEQIEKVIAEQNSVKKEELGKVHCEMPTQPILPLPYETKETNSKISQPHESKKEIETTIIPQIKQQPKETPKSTFEKPKEIAKETIIPQQSTTKEEPKKSPISKEEIKSEVKVTEIKVAEKSKVVQPIKIEKPIEKPIEKLIEKPIQKVVEKHVEKQIEKPVEKHVEKIIEKPIPVDIIKPLQKSEPVQEKKKYVEEEATGFFGKITQKFTTTKLTKQEFDDLFWELEMGLLENNVALEIIELFKTKLESSLVDKPLKRGQVEETIYSALTDTIDEAISFTPVDFAKTVRSKRPYVICFVGINGSGKTTTIAKVAHFLKQNKISSVMAAGDTFRAAAIQQLEEHAQNLNIKIIKHDYGSDAAAVAFDAIAYAKAHDLDTVLIDTAGRMHSNTNLMDEMKKIVRVAKPDMVLFVGESITGNDCIEQAKQFNE